LAYPRHRHAQADREDSFASLPADVRAPRLASGPGRFPHCFTVASLRGLPFLPYPEKFVDRVVAVLHRKEAACMLEVFRGPKQVRRAAVRYEHAGRLIVLAMRERGRVATQGDKADRRLLAVAGDVEGPYAVERVQLGMEGVAAILRREQLLLAGEGEVVERVVLVVAEEEERDSTVVRVCPVIIVVTEIDAEDGSVRTARLQERVLARNGVGVPGRVEEERPEVRSGQPRHVLRTF